MLTPTQSRMVYAVGILAAALSLMWVMAAPAEGHTDPHAVFVDAEGDALILGDPYYYPETGTWDEVRHAFVTMTQTCDGWYLIDFHHDIGNPDYYCEGLAEVWEFQHAWDWLTTHWAGEQEYGPPYTKETWRPLVEKYFKAADVEKALRVMECETAEFWHPDIQYGQREVPFQSGILVPATVSEHRASGLFQHMPRYFYDRAERAGYHDPDIFDPETNIAMAAWLVYDSGDGRGWGHWPNCGKR